jgi:nucleoside-diphosphate-sugar epimerase
MNHNLDPIATNRDSSLFAPDVDAFRGVIEDQIKGRRILVLGGAGSIGGATLRQLLNFSCDTIHVVDQNENQLAELVRDLNSTAATRALSDFQVLPLNINAPAFQRLLIDEPPYDVVLNFAALKHVRSEKDPYSLLQMIQTNVLEPVQLLRSLAERGRTTRYFAVSTDKAANPVNLMGATKRAMEHAIFSEEVLPGDELCRTSARFANVAFSNGSLLESFGKRLEKRQPLAAPRDTRRFFVSQEEAGQICLLAAFATPAQHILFPLLSSKTDLRPLDLIATQFLEHYGYEPVIYEREEDARQGLEADLAENRYPLLLTPLDTAGEKSFEEFLSGEEQQIDVRMSALAAIPYRPPADGRLTDFIARIHELTVDRDTPLSKERIIAEFHELVPEFRHYNSTRSLDTRM